MVNLKNDERLLRIEKRKKKKKKYLNRVRWQNAFAAFAIFKFWSCTEMTRHKRTTVHVCINIGIDRKIDSLASHGSIFKLSSQCELSMWSARMNRPVSGRNEFEGKHRFVCPSRLHTRYNGCNEKEEFRSHLLDLFATNFFPFHLRYNVMAQPKLLNFVIFFFHFRFQSTNGFARFPICLFNRWKTLHELTGCITTNTHWLM